MDLVGHARARDAGELQIDAAFRPSRRQVELVISGDLDRAGESAVLAALQAAFISSFAVVVRLDAVGVFGSAACRIVESMIRQAEATETPLRIEGIPTHVLRVLDIVGLDSPHIERRSTAPEPLMPAQLDTVMAKALMAAREAVMITTDDVDDPRIVFVNRALCTMTGYRADDLLGGDPRTLHGPLTDRRVLERIDTQRRRNQRSDGEAVAYRADGAPFWMNWQIVGITHDARRYQLALQRDVTTLHQLQRFELASAQLRATGDGDLDHVAGALSDAVGVLVEAAPKRVSVVVCDPGGDVVGRSAPMVTIEDRWLAERHRTECFTVDGGSFHVPFPLDDGWWGHLRVDELHPDWLRLVDPTHLEALCAMAAMRMRAPSELVG